jgi:F0F1-type ATP synthase gamma subunit
MAASMKEVRDRIESVKSTKKITDAMKLVAAAKVREGSQAPQPINSTYGVQSARRLRAT